MNPTHPLAPALQTPRMRGTLLLLLTLAGACDSDGGTATLVVRNGNVWTGTDRELAQAVAVVDDRVAAVGTDEEISAWVGTDTRVVDAQGGLVTPGFIDAHVHFLDGGHRLSSVQLRDAATPEEFTRRISDFAASVAPGTWITGGDWDHENWGGELPRAEWIDAATPDHPVAVHRLDGHMILANTAAMRAAGVDRTTPDVGGGEIVRDAAGNPTGVFKDNAIGLVFSAAPGPTEELDDRALDAAMAYVAAQGVTSVHHMGGFHELDTFERAHAEGRLLDGPGLGLDRHHARHRVHAPLRLGADADEGGVVRHRGPLAPMGLPEGIRGRIPRVAYGRLLRAVH